MQLTTLVALVARPSNIIVQLNLRLELVALTAALALCACGGQTAVAALQLGGADANGTGFHALAGDAELVPGAQGGFHVWLKLRLRGLPQGQRVRIRYDARREADGRLYSQGERGFDLGGGPEGLFETPEPIPIFMCPPPLGQRVMATPMRFTLTLSSEDGTPLGSAATSFTPRCPTGEQAEFCNRICAG